MIKPMTSGMAGLFCIYNNLGLMLHNSNAEKHQVSFNSIMQLPRLEITSVWFKASHDAAIKAVTESEVI